MLWRKVGGGGHKEISLAHGASQTLNIYSKKIYLILLCVALYNNTRLTVIPIPSRAYLPLDMSYKNVFFGSQGRV